MPGPAKKRHIKIEDVESALKQEGLVASKVKAVVRRLKAVVSEDDESISADELFEDLFGKESKPSVMLRGARHKVGLTQDELADKLGTNQPAIAAMENGKRTIGKDMAKRLSSALDVDYRLFL